MENILYIPIALCLLGQVVIGKYYLLGQNLFLLANIISIIRTFAMKRPVSDKVKDSCFVAVTIGLIIIYLAK